MIGALAAALLSAGLPEGTARYRVELAGAPLGAAELSIRCQGPACLVAWSSALRAPAEAGGAVRTRRLEAEVDSGGRLTGAVRLRVDGAARDAHRHPGRVPASAAEPLLLAAGEPACVEAFDEESGRTGAACLRREAGATVVELLGEREELVPSPDGFPAEVRIPAQGIRFLRDPEARVPTRAPRLSVRVPGPADPGAARRFCGVPVDPAPAVAPPPAAPPPRAGSGSCREQAEAWVAAAARAGLTARLALGVAHDGAGYAWHAWAEVRRGEAWIPIDPAFGEAPARGPRFTLARYAAGDGAARAEAGRRILACWGRARVE